MPGVKNEKERIRREVLALRRALTLSEATSLSAAIAAQVWTLDEVKRATVLLSYVDSKDQEVQTRPLIRTALAEGREVLVPISESSGDMTWSRLESLGDLSPGRYGILEPRTAVQAYRVLPSGIPCLVPGIAFSRTCQRIGYGFGYFDRFLSKNDVVAIGLAYGFQVRATLPVDARDVDLTIIVTETDIYRP